ncbi:flavin monoamine oxidase family protein [Microbulbifer sp.]|uniref:flavin monoamine oxidase family protein n=1 Tax=Microbulbifer sp. TaxID=1908541 RepID=UPI002F93B218
MRSADIAIVGGGLSGLYTAYRLEQMGVKEYLLIEARDALGGRIESTPEFSPGDSDRFDLGPTWFWPDLQPQLDRLVHDLALERFAQFEEGDMLVERAQGEPPLRTRGYINTPTSMRLAGGMSSLINALGHRVDVSRIMTGHTVHTLNIAGRYVEILCEDSSGHTSRVRARHILLAVPPRLLVERIGFTPPLPQSLSEQWRATATWMAPHAKYIAIYERPFWREHGLSGEARSAIGPLNEIHDASTPYSSGALFGFFGVPAQIRSTVPEEILLSHCRKQLARLFGPQAATPKAEFIKDWAMETHTASAADLIATGDHSRAPVNTPTSGPWHSKITGIASEWSPQFPGYVAGAIDAVDLGIRALPKMFRDDQNS